MQGDNLLISKSNFVGFRKGNIEDFYQIDPKQIGKGAYGIVYKAKLLNKKGPYRAIKKILKKAIRNPNSIKNQIQNLARLDHPTIIKIYQIFEDQKYLYLITDYCQGGQLFQKLQKIGSFSQRDARKIFSQMMQAINYCHKQKIAHRDLKPQNFLFLNQYDLNLKLIDFGLSFKWSDCMMDELIQKNDTKLVGTSYYIAPQIISGRYDQKCDIWSAGIILYILITAIPPFDGQTDKQIIQCVKNGQYTFEIPQMKKISYQCKDLIHKILMPSNNRFTIDQIFNHPWMKSDLPNISLELNFKRMKDFTKFNKLKKIIANFIASKLSQKQVQKLALTFKQIDTNHDGYLSIQQLKKVLQKQKKFYQTTQLQTTFIDIDTDKNGLLNYTQFIASTIEQNKIFTIENLLSVFKIIDKDGNGILDRQQIKSILQQNNHSLLNGKQIDDMMNLCDINKDGLIDFNQFVNSMTSA